MWEMFMEREYPSTNDIIATPIGGAAIGEVLFRASDALIDDRLSGSERFSREAAVFLLSPLRGLNRIIYGRGMESETHERQDVRYAEFCDTRIHWLQDAVIQQPFQRAYIKVLQCRLMPNMAIGLRLNPPNRMTTSQ